VQLRKRALRRALVAWGNLCKRVFCDQLTSLQHFNGF
jgi:hypothetical protein